MMEKHYRKSIRLKEYDYSQTGAYFVTICARNHESVFGEIVDGEMLLNESGWMVQNCWNVLQSRLTGIELDAFVVMPNHVHGIICIVGAGLALPSLALPDSDDPALTGAASSAPTGLGVSSSASTPGPKNRPTVGDVVRVFKSTSAIKINRIFSRTGWSIWQRNYYEHVIRDEESLNRIREYIEGNPLSWSFDRENPDRKAEDPFEKWMESRRGKPRPYQNHPGVEVY